MYIFVNLHIAHSSDNVEKAAITSQKTNSFIGSSSTESASKSNINTIVMTQLVMRSIVLYTYRHC